MKQKSLNGNLVLSTFYQVVNVVYPLLTAPYIARVLGVEDIGTYSFTQSIQEYFAIIAVLGTSVYGTREIAKARDDVRKRNILFWEIELLSCFTGIISLICYFFVASSIDEYRIYFFILSINIVAKIFDISWLYAGIEEFKFSIIINSVIRTAGVITQFLLVKEDGLTTYILIHTVSALLGNLSMWIFVPKFIGRVSLKELHIFRHFHGTLVYFIPTIASTAYSYIDKTVIGLVANSSSENGYYEQATKVVTLAQTFTFSGLNTVIQSRNSYLFEHKEFNEMRITISRSIDYILSMGIGIIFGIFGVAKRFVPLFFGPGYDRVIILLYVLCPLVIISGISGCLSGQYYTPAGRRKESSKYLICGLVLNFILNLILIPHFYGVGAAIASVIGEILILFLYSYNCRLFINTFKIVATKIWKKMISGLVMYCVVLGIGFLSDTNLWICIIQVCCGICTYFLMLLMCKDSLALHILNEFCQKVITRKAH